MSGGDMVWLPWAGLGAAVALLGTWWAARRGDTPATLRRGGYAIGVLGLWALGVPSLLWHLWAALGGWAGRLLLNPLSWVGAIATAVSVVLVVTGIAWGNRREPRQKITGSRWGRRKKPEPGALEPPATRSTPGNEDPEIEAILRRHGIS